MDANATCIVCQPGTHLWHIPADTDRALCGAPLGAQLRYLPCQLEPQDQICPACVNAHRAAPRAARREHVTAR